MSLMSYWQYFEREPELHFHAYSNPDDVNVVVSHLGRTVYAQLQYGDVRFRVRCVASDVGAVTVYAAPQVGPFANVRDISGLQSWLKEQERMAHEVVG